MTFPIDTTVPAANNYPGDDQQPMQTNFSNINQYVQVDHTNPAATGAGQHKQVTFNSNNVPAVPTAPPVLFTNNDATSTPQLFWYSGSTTKTSNQYAINSSSGSGYALGGLIIKCGKFTAVSGSSVTLNYSGADNPLNPFPNNTLSVVVSVSNSSVTAGVADGSLNASSFRILKSNSSPATIFFIAIGY